MSSLPPPVLRPILDGTGQTWGKTYWPIWLLILVVSFLGPEIYALASGNASNTLSAWVWRALQVSNRESLLMWSATDFLVFGAWAVLVVWLTGHFFFGLFH